MDKTSEHEKALRDEIKNYSKLEKINNTDEFNDFFAMQVATVTQKILSLFTGTGPANWEEFCKVRGEVIGILYPIQQVRGAKVVKQQLAEQLNEMYNSET